MTNALDRLLLKKGTMEEHQWCRSYYIEQIMIVPHYNKQGVFVLPGGKEVPEQVLIDAGGVRTASYLWPRSWAKEITT
jgi:hypothetical protein